MQWDRRTRSASGTTWPCCSDVMPEQRRQRWRRRLWPRRGLAVGCVEHGYGGPARKVRMAETEGGATSWSAPAHTGAALHVCTKWSTCGLRWSREGNGPWGLVRRLTRRSALRVVRCGELHMELNQTIARSKATRWLSVGCAQRVIARVRAFVAFITPPWQGLHPMVILVVYDARLLSGVRSGFHQPMPWV